MRLAGYSQPRGCDCSASGPRAVAKAATRTVKESSALKLTLKTEEGDTVEISLEAQSLHQSERGSARGRGGRISQKRDSQSNSLTASVKVDGNLSNAEMEDIKGLLQPLAGGGAPQAGEGDLDTVSAYQYSYQRTHEVMQSEVEVHG